jgi:hypothetical protein
MYYLLIDGCDVARVQQSLEVKVLAHAHRSGIDRSFAVPDRCPSTVRSSDPPYQVRLANASTSLTRPETISTSPLCTTVSGVA